MINVSKMFNVQGGFGWSEESGEKEWVEIETKGMKDKGCTHLEVSMNYTMLMTIVYTL